MLPESLVPPIQKALVAAGDTTPIRHARTVGGGCISNVSCVETDHNKYLLKWNTHPLPRMFLVEAWGLELLGSTKTIRVPAVFGAAGLSPEHPPYILTEWLEPTQGMAPSIDQAVLGSQLAHMHRTGVSPNIPPSYGLDYDNYIGRLPQYNTWSEDWVSFYCTQRLAPQMEIAAQNGLLPAQRRKRFETLMHRLAKWFGGVTRQPALLHGDLWGGNVIAGPGGAPALIDPAVYYGDREAELAYTELFGGFSPQFYQAYREAWPLEAGYEERRDLYNLYHLLNHLNHFGESFGAQIDHVLSRFVE